MKNWTELENSSFFDANAVNVLWAWSTKGPLRSF